MAALPLTHLRQRHAAAATKAQSPLLIWRRPACAIRRPPGTSSIPAPLAVGNRVSVIINLLEITGAGRAQIRPSQHVQGRRVMPVAMRPYDDLDILIELHEEMQQPLH